MAGINFGGTLGVFSDLRVISFVLIFFLVEQTHGTDLEYLGRVFSRSKLEFARLQFRKLVPSFGKTGPAQDHEMSSTNEDGNENSSEGTRPNSYNATRGADTDANTSV